MMKTNAKSALSTLFMGMAVLAFTACGGNNTDSDQDKDHSEQQEHMDHDDGMHNDEHMDDHDHSEAESHDHDAMAMYQCPMDCEDGKTYDEPGKCPECGMPLEKVEE